MLQGAQEALSEWGIDAAPEDFVPFIGAGEDRFVGGVAGCTASRTSKR